MDNIQQTDIWLTDLERALQERDLFEQVAYLEGRIRRAEAWLEAHPDADEVWYERFEALVDRQAELLDRIALLRSGQPVEVAVRLPADYAGVVGREWEELENGEIVAWFTPDELEAAAWVHTILCRKAPDALYWAA